MLRNRMPLIALAVLLLGAGHGPKTRTQLAAKALSSGVSPVLANTLSTSFAGDDDVVSIGKPANMDLTPGVSVFSMSLWIKRGEAGDFERHTGGKARMAGGGQVGVVTGVRADEAAEALVYGGENTFGGNIAPGGVFGWHCYSMSINGATARVYLDGTQVGSTFAVGAGPWETTASWLIGGSRGGNDVEVWYPWKGSIDEVTFWSDNLTDAQHVELCQRAVPMNPLAHTKVANLIHWYRMGDGDTYPTITDRVGSANGTCQNMAGAGNITSDVP